MANELSRRLGGFIGEADSPVNRTAVNKVFNRLVPQQKLERMLTAFGPEVAAEAPYIWNDMLDSFIVTLSSLVDIQGSLATQAKKRMRSAFVSSGTGMSRNLAAASAEDREEFAASLIEAVVDALLPEASEVPKEGKARAQKRMDDAAKRGGIQKMIQATLQRINATESPEKLQGIVAAVDELISQLERIKKAAQG